MVRNVSTLAGLIRHGGRVAKEVSANKDAARKLLKRFATILGLTEDMDSERGQEAVIQLLCPVRDRLDRQAVKSACRSGLAQVVRDCPCEVTSIIQACIWSNNSNCSPAALRVLQS